MIAVGFAWWLNGRIRAAEARRFKPASEIDRVEYAVSNARSWHSTTQGTLHGQAFQTDADVVCPFQSHTVTRARDGSNPVISEIIETRDRMYAREGGQPWSSEPRPGTEKCRNGPMAGPSTLLSTLAGLKTATPVRGELLQAGGNSCRVWNFLANSGVSLATLCVDDITHLPYEVKQGTLDVRYSEWNMPIVIAAPDGTTDQNAGPDS